MAYFLFFFVGLLLLPFSLNSWSHIFGTPQTNYGLIHLLFMGCGLALIPKASKTDLYSSLFFIILFSLINALSHPQYKLEWLDNWHPYNFTALFGALCLLPLGILLKTENNIWVKRIGICFVIALILLSQNKTMKYSLLILGPLFYLLRNVELKRWHAAVLVSVIPFAVLGVEALSYAHFNLGSVTSRFITHTGIFKAFVAEPLRILTGFGFGNSGQLVDIHLTELPIELYKKTLYSPTWDGIDRLEFDSYHGIIETFTSAGILGALLQLSIWIIPILKSKQKDLVTDTFLVSLWILHHCMWFTLPVQWVFDILFFRLILPNENITSAKPFVLKTFSFLFWVPALVLIHIMITFNRIETPLTRLFPESLESNVMLYKNTQTFGNIVLDDILEGEASTQMLHKFILATKNLEDFPFVTIYARTKACEFLFPDFKAEWEKTIIYAMKRYGSRYDLVYSYLKRSRMSDKFVNKYLKLYPNNPALLWYYWKYHSLTLDQLKLVAKLQKFVCLG